MSDDGVWVKVYPPEAVPGIGDWSNVTAMTGSPTRVDYTEGDFAWTSLQWSSDGSITVTEGLMDTLVVGGGAAASSSFSGGAGGVLHGVQDFTAATHTILVGTTPTGGSTAARDSTSGRVSDLVIPKTASTTAGGRSAIGDDSIGGGLARAACPNGFEDYESGGYGAGAGSTGNATDVNTGGPGYVSSINGTSLEYAQGGGKYRSDAEYAALPPGSGSDRQNDSNVAQYRGTDGTVIVRVPTEYVTATGGWV